MMKISFDDKATDKEKYIWNMLGSLSNAFSSLIFSIAVNRFFGSNSGGVFAFAYSNSQLMYTIGTFEVRPYQSTDVSEKYSYDTYFWMRMISCAIMVICSIVYAVCNPFSFEKTAVVLCLCGYRLMDAFSDLLAGRFQQKDRIDMSGKICFIRIVFCTIAFMMAMIISRKFLFSCIILLAASVVALWINEFRVVYVEDRRKYQFDIKKIAGLMTEVLPLFIGSFVMMYINNASKYAINSIYSDEIQNIYNILFMPAFVINLFSLFVFRPLLIKMALYREQKQYGSLLKIILKMYLMIVAITIVTVVGSALVGIPILSILYGVNLASYKIQLLFIMSCGGISALMTFAYYCITVLRQQRWLLIAYGAAFLVALLITRSLVKTMCINGAILAYAVSIGIIVAIFSVVIFTVIIKQMHIQNKNKR